MKCVICKTPFLWTASEQKAAAQAAPDEQGPARPDRCPMCRRIAPAAGRMRGIVKWYNRTKGYGFITTVQGQDVFVHKSELAEGLAPCAGQLVEFGLEQGPRGIQAGSVEVLQTSEAAKPC
jgi:cold shock protein